MVDYPITIKQEKHIVNAKCFCFLFFVVFFVFSQRMMAYDLLIDGIAYNIDVEKRTLAVTYGGDYVGSVSIPDELEYNTQVLKVTKIETEAFRGCSKLKSIILGNNIEDIGYGAFSGCVLLSELVIPESVKKISNNAFENCPKLIRLVIQDSKTTLHMGRYYVSSQYGSASRPLCYSTKLEELYLGRDLTYDSYGDVWEKRAFANLNTLKTLTIGKHVTSIDSFSGTKNIVLIECNIEDPDLCDVYFDNDIYAKAALIVPTGTLSSYQQAKGWCKFFNIKEKTSDNIEKRIQEDQQSVRPFFNLQGIPTASPHRGIYIRNRKLMLK